MGKLFGTDGLRGKAGEFPLDHATTELLGRILYFLLQDRELPLELIVGRDTRESGPTLLNALCRGFCGAGGKVDDAGILPTPALAFLAKLEQKCSISITASHNPYQDNGIKIFGPDGYKISEQAEAEIEPFLLGEKPFLRNSTKPGSVNPLPLQDHFSSKYRDHLSKDLFPNLSLRGLKIALDCANGALSWLAPEILREMEAEVAAFNVDPNGKNINDHCGSLYPDFLAAKVKENSFDCGFTFDGDGDRCLIVDHGAVYDGDFILAAAAGYLLKRGELKKNAVVATSMSNMGLEVYFKKFGITLHRVPVGDKNVLEKLEKEDLSLGGEQSGHIIFKNDSFIGDGLLTALQILRIQRTSGTPFSSLWDGFRKFPQTLLNVPVEKKPDFETVPEVQQRIHSIEEELADAGRILVRYSGTEMLARIMIEGPNQERIEQMAADLGAIIRSKLGS